MFLWLKHRLKLYAVHLHFIILLAIWLKEIDKSKTTALLYYYSRKDVSMLMLAGV